MTPLADRIERRGRERSTRTEATERADRGTSQASTTSKRDESAGSAKATGRADRTAGRAAKPATTARADGEEPREPGWLTDLTPGERGRARRLMSRLEEDGIPDAEGLVRRDVVGDVAAIAAAAIRRRLAGLGDDAPPDDVADLLADGRDDRLDVRWRLVDGDGRPIVLDRGSRRRR